MPSSSCPESGGPLRRAGAWRHAVSRRRGAPAPVVSASLPASLPGSETRTGPVLARLLRSALPWTIPLLVATGCSQAILGDDPDTGLEVEVHRGPLNPVEIQGEPNSAPVADASVEVRRVEGGRTRVRTDADGLVRVPLAPGDYVVEVLSCPGSLVLPEPGEATVEAGFLTALRLDCDTGIR